MKAQNLKEGHVLVDTEGHLYEVMSVIRNLPDTIHAWLWPDSSPVPNYFQTFKPDEDIVSVNAREDDTVVIPFVKEDDDVPDADGTAE
jgi:hypothetical protein